MYLQKRSLFFLDWAILGASDRSRSNVIYRDMLFQLTITLQTILFNSYPFDVRSAVYGGGETTF
jgi:hypothetical protein